jgi:hypothetical protein
MILLEIYMNGYMTVITGTIKVLLMMDRYGMVEIAQSE